MGDIYYILPGGIMWQNEVNLYLLFHCSTFENTWCSHFISLGLIIISLGVIKRLGCTHFTPKVNVHLLYFATLLLQVKCC